MSYYRARKGSLGAARDMANAVLLVIQIANRNNGELIIKVSPSGLILSHTEGRKATSCAIYGMDLDVSRPGS